MSVNPTNWNTDYSFIEKKKRESGERSSSNGAVLEETHNWHMTILPTALY